MKMDEDNRPDDASEEEESDAGWYFDLPKGAWERQEAKNRELRQSVRRNMDAEPPKRDAFGPKEDGRDLRQEEEPPSWRALHSDEPAQDDDLKWSLPDSSEDDQPAEVEYSTEPETPLELPLSLRSQRMPDEEPPAIKPPAGLFGHTDEPPLASDDEDKAPQPAVERRIIRRFQADKDDEQPVPFVRGDIPAPAPVEQPQSRWGEIFSEKAADGANMLDSMRAWAKSAEARNQEADAFDGDQPPATSHSLEATAQEPTAFVPSVSQPITPDDLPIRVQHHDEDEPPLVNADNPTTRWDQMFARKASDDAGLLDGMRAWATKPEDQDEDAGPPRMRLTPETEDVDASLFKPFEWEQSSDEAAPLPREAAYSEPEPGEKKGFLGRLFGKKKPDEAELPAARHPDQWPPADDAPEDFPGGLSFGRDEEPRGSWLGRSDGDENRFASTEPERPLQWADIARHPQPPADSPWALEEEPAAPGAPLDDDAEWEPEPAAEAAGPSFGAPQEPTPAIEPASVDEDERPTSPAAPAMVQIGGDEDAPREPWDPFASLKTGDDAGWDPEPFEPAAATVADDEPYALRTALQPATDEDPWRSVDAVEQEASPTAAEWQPSAPLETSVTPEAPSQAADPDDPWAVYMAGRTVDETGTSHSGATPEAHVEGSASRSPADEDSEEQDSPWPAVAATAAAAAIGASVADVPDALDSPADEVEGPTEERSSLWDSAFARVHDEEPAAETPTEDAPSPARQDDPWAAIAEASGFEPGSEEIAIFRGTADVEDALERYEAEREAEEAVAATAPEALPAELDEASAVNLPAWDDSEVEDDTVLRAFQAHAALYEDAAAPDDMPEPDDDTETVIFDDLLGEDADEIVAEASQQAAEGKYFGRMQGWAPQRSPAERQAFPWEAETVPTERVRPPGSADAMDDDDEPALEGWSRVEEPPAPWTHTTAAAHTDAPSVRRKSRSRMLVREIVETGLLALLVFLAVRASFQNFKVDGLSMYPTLEDGEYLIVNKLAYAEVDMDRLGNFVPFVDPGEDPTREVFGGPERGDIVVLQDPREEDTDLIKRIIGLPGETIEIVDGDVYINDFLLEEPYIKQEWNDTKAKILIPEGYYFVMGDNRSNSLDSRSADIGLISKELIIGKAALTYWPRSKFGLAPNESGDISEKDGPPVVTTQALED